MILSLISILIPCNFFNIYEHYLKRNRWNYPWATILGRIFLFLMKVVIFFRIPSDYETCVETPSHINNCSSSLERNNGIRRICLLLETRYGRLVVTFGDQDSNRKRIRRVKRPEAATIFQIKYGDENLFQM